MWAMCRVPTCNHYLLTLGAHVQKGLCVCVCVSVKSHQCLFVLKILSHTQRAMKVKKFCGDFSETAPLQIYTASYVLGYFSDIPRTFSTAEPSKGPKRANDRLNSTWNTT